MHLDNRPKGATVVLTFRIPFHVVELRRLAPGDKPVTSKGDRWGSLSRSEKSCSGSSSVGHERYVQSKMFSACYAGAEANVAVSLAALGYESYFVTRLP